jgi:hypothetical protein
MLSGSRYSSLARSNTIRTPREVPAALCEGTGSSESAEIFLDLISEMQSFGTYSSSEAIPQRILAELKD